MLPVTYQGVTYHCELPVYWCDAVGCEASVPDGCPELKSWQFKKSGTHFCGKCAPRVEVEDDWSDVAANSVTP